VQRLQAIHKNTYGIPQGLKPAFFLAASGTAEAVPSHDN